MSAVLVKPEPIPGLLLFTKLGSRVPRAEVSGEPRFNPCPAMKWQFVPSIKWTNAQFSVCPFSVSVCVPPSGATPGKVRNFAELNPEGANARKAEVSYQPLVVALAALLSSFSNEKKAKSLL